MGTEVVASDWADELARDTWRNAQRGSVPDPDFSPVEIVAIALRCAYASGVAEERSHIATLIRRTPIAELRKESVIHSGDDVTNGARSTRAVILRLVEGP